MTKRKTKTDKPFALFAGITRARGGFYDFRERYSTLAEAKHGADGWRHAGTSGLDWYHVVDLRTMKIVAES